MSDTNLDKALVIAGKTYTSRLLVGTGKYKDNEETGLAIETSGAEIVTIGLRVEESEIDDHGSGDDSKDSQ